MLKHLLDVSHYGLYLALAIAAKVGTDYAVMQLRDTPPNTPESKRWSKNWHAWGATQIFAGAGAAAFGAVGRYGLRWAVVLLIIAALWGLLFDISLNLRRALRWDYIGQEAASDGLIARMFPAALLKRVGLSAGGLAAVLKFALAAGLGVFYYFVYVLR